MSDIHFNAKRPKLLRRVAADCKLPLAPARELSIDTCDYAVSQHARWPVRMPHPSYANEDAWVVVTLKRPKVNSDPHRRVTFTHVRVMQHHAQGWSFSNTSFCPHSLSLASVPSSLWDQQEVTLEIGVDWMGLSIIRNASRAYVGPHFCQILDSRLGKFHHELQLPISHSICLT